MANNPIKEASIRIRNFLIAAYLMWPIPLGYMAFMVGYCNRFDETSVYYPVMVFFAYVMGTLMAMTSLVFITIPVMMLLGEETARDYIFNHVIPWFKQRLRPQ